MAGKERFHGGHFPKRIVLQVVLWYLRYSLSYRDIEELMKERGFEIDHATVQRWVVKYTPILETKFRKRKRAVDSSWRIDETYIKVKGKWCYLYRAIDKEGKTIDFLLTKNRDKLAAKRFLIKAISNNRVPKKIIIDESATNKSALEEYNNENGTFIEIRQVTYLNNIVEQDHRGVKRRTNSMLGFKSFDSASITLTGIEIVHTLRKGQLATQGISVQSLAETFYSLAA
jgi:putative transposase